MEFNLHKCSSKEHLNINSNYYCFDCKIYMCNKCDNMHSKLFQNHSKVKSDKNINEIYKLFCNENNHNEKLEFYCKDHNKLCCGLCLCKIKDKGMGQHKDCDVCIIEDIKNEKMNKLEENIKLLENLSKNIEEIINNLEKIFNEINKNKEEIKLEIQNTFTKIRNLLNEREDKLLLEVDKQFSDIFSNENIIKECKKLPNKIKSSLEEGKSIKQKNENKENVNMCIIDLINIENNINSIKTLKKNIEDCNNIKSKPIKFIQKIEIKEFENLFKSFGDIVNDLKIFSDSLIINNNKSYIDSLIKLIGNDKIEVKLLYRKSRDGTSYDTFHELCDNKGPTLILFNLERNNLIIGGYTQLNWDNHSGWKSDKSTFLFNLTNGKLFKKKSGNDSMYCSNDCGPFFPYIGCRNTGKRNMSEGDFQMEFSHFENIKEIIQNDGKNTVTFNIKEVEVYQISK